ncbi:MAG: hypothetical protein MR446_08390, partial [Bacteroidales bacterium]|nr:hypothetical protein [Bacteroidales bacterium]
MNKLQHLRVFCISMPEKWHFTPQHPTFATAWSGRNGLCALSFSPKTTNNPPHEKNTLYPLAGLDGL